MSKTEAKHTTELQAAAHWLADAEDVIIVGGAGISIGCGLNYSDPADFKKQYPAMLQYGVKTGYECMGLSSKVKPAVDWGYRAQHMWNMRYRDKPHQGYVDLLSMVGKKNYFVLTSNVDGLFYRAGFEAKRIYTPQGDFANLQCIKPCHLDVYPSLPVIEPILPKIDKATQAIPESMIPKCPKCSGPMMMNVRGGDWYIHQPYAEQNKAFIKFVEESKESGRKLAVLEVGSGFNTPMVTRWPAESISRWIKNASFIRVNLDYSEVPLDLPRAVGIPMEGRQALAQLRALVEQAAGNSSVFSTTSVDTKDSKADSSSNNNNSNSSNGSSSATSTVESKATASSKELQTAATQVTASREQARQQAKQNGMQVVEMWHQIQARSGHFDWKRWMLSLSRDPKPGQDNNNREDSEDDEEAD